MAHVDGTRPPQLYACTCVCAPCMPLRGRARLALQIGLFHTAPAPAPGSTPRLCPPAYELGPASLVAPFGEPRQLIERRAICPFLLC